MRPLRLLPLLLALVLAGCTSEAPTGEPDSSPENPPAGESAPEPLVATVRLGEQGPGGLQYYLRGEGTDDLRVGVPVNLTVVNEGSRVHDLVIPAFDVSTGNIQAGGEISVTFTPDEAGTFEMSCSLGQAPLDHKSNGMAGTITVKE